jgi:glutathione S-transferase
MKNGFLCAALRRFDNEMHRIDGVMNPGLFNKRYLAAGQYTIADMICYPWASQTHSWRDTDSNLRQASFNFDPPRFGAKRLEQQRDWRTGRNQPRPIVTLIFPKNPFFTRT